MLTSKEQLNAAYFLKNFTDFYERFSHQDYVDQISQFMEDGISNVSTLEHCQFFDSLLVYREIYKAAFWKLLARDEYAGQRVYSIKGGREIYATAQPFEENLTMPWRYVDSRLPEREETRRDILSDFGKEFALKTDNTLFSLMTYNEPYTRVDGRDVEEGDVKTAITYLRDQGHNPDLITLTPYALAVLMPSSDGSPLGTLCGCAVCWTPLLSQSSSEYRVSISDSEAFGRILLKKKFSIEQLTKTEYRLSGAITFVGLNLTAAATIKVNNGQ